LRPLISEYQGMQGFRSPKVAGLAKTNPAAPIRSGLGKKI